MRDSNSRPLGPKPSALAIWANSRNFTSFLEWWAWVDSNHRPHPYQRCALTAWATRPFYIIIYKVVPRGRIELPTQGFSGLCSTTELPWLFLLMCIRDISLFYLFIFLLLCFSRNRTGVFIVIYLLISRVFLWQKSNGIDIGIKA